MRWNNSIRCATMLCPRTSIVPIIYCRRTSNCYQIRFQVALYYADDSYASYVMLSTRSTATWNARKCCSPLRWHQLMTVVQSSASWSYKDRVLLVYDEEWSHNNTYQGGTNPPTGDVDISPSINVFNLDSNRLALVTPEWAFTTVGRSRFESLTFVK